MKQKLIAGLEACGFVNGKTVILQGTLAENEPYPEEFVTIWTDFTADNSHFDNAVASVDWNFTVIYYTSDPEKLAKKPKEIINTLRQAGFIPQGRGQDIPSDEKTHTGWAMEFIYKEILQSEG